MQELIYHERPQIERPRLVMGLSGWMDGGNVSTGTISYLRDRLQARRFAQINALGFNILNFPMPALPVAVVSEEARAVLASVNPMEFAALFRPHAKIEKGLVAEFETPLHLLHAAPASRLLLLAGDEPHIRWHDYCELIFDLAADFSVNEIFFVGSVASPVPHTREPRVRASLSAASLVRKVRAAGAELTDYEGPSSIITYLTAHAAEHGIDMYSLVVEVPHYPFLEMPTYPASILKTMTTLSRLLDLDLDLADLREASQDAEDKLDVIMKDNPQFEELVRKLETAYDSERFEVDEALLRRLIDELDSEEGEERR